MKTFLKIAVALNCFVAYCQEVRSVATLTDDRNLIKMEIPAAINGSNLDPAAISSVNVNFTDSKISAKVGIPFKKIDNYENLKYTVFLSANVKATNGVGTLWNAESKPSEFGFNGGMSYMWKHYVWNSVNANGEIITPKTSESYYWINFRGGLDWAKLNIFRPENGYEFVNNEIRDQFGNAYIAINHYYGSKLDRLNRFFQHIASIGLGYAKTNNYSNLKSRTLQEGTLLYNADSTAYNSVVKTTAGRIGNYEVYEGLTTFGELFWPVIKRERGSIYLGNRYTYYAVGKSRHISNGSSGLYFNLKEKDTKKDIVNFSVVAQFDHLNESKSEDYLDKYFSVLLQASIPLSFY